MVKSPNLAGKLKRILGARGVVAEFLDDVVVRDDGGGQPPVLVYWNADKLGPAPTQADVDAIDELATLRDVKWAEIKRARDLAISGGFTFNLKPIQSDPASRANIAGAAQAASFAKSAGAPFSVKWTCADNTVMALTADQAIAMFQTGVQHMQALYDRGVQLREQLAVAATPEQIEAVNW